MSYGKEVYKDANKILEEIREKNRYILNKRKEEINEKIPEYSLLKKEMIELLGGYVSVVGTENNNYNVDELKEKIALNEEKRKKILTSNGYPTNYLDDIYNCSLCKDTGYILNKQCSCMEKILCKVAIEKSNMNNLFLNDDFDKFDINLFSDSETNGLSPKSNMKNILSHVRYFIDEYKEATTKSMLFTGNTGVGKTFLSTCIAKKIIEKGAGVLYMSAPKIAELLEEYKFNRSSLSFDNESKVHLMKKIDLLIIDDLGTEFKTGYTLNAIYDLINDRLINNKKMIISTNLSMEEIKDTYSERLFSRFLGEFTILEFIGEDLRTKKILK